ncbi:Piso0_003644 [Millerozyma farinosa CBS 7064]|uniref:Piso0_003644 protein n=1 Tax=Pichia sorbitophila (strain ATCC MYA-4447 / BCRC 22081 / CBS 7064 / NBRC 10061 / NRRL Y-12695) TaxID=559304 RepID=G8YGH3_PICSO|nr:Piso0_003644 [Millerozyma farinosa CBS 7064]CCE81290.1 Piso0_003644 [Millerozyma farinosa CBS 7064]
MPPSLRLPLLMAPEASMSHIHRQTPRQWMYVCYLNDVLGRGHCPPCLVERDPSRIKILPQWYVIVVLDWDKIETWVMRSS